MTDTLTNTFLSNINMAIEFMPTIWKKAEGHYYTLTHLFTTVIYRSLHNDHMADKNLRGKCNNT